MRRMSSLFAFLIIGVSTIMLMSAVFASFTCKDSQFAADSANLHLDLTLVETEVVADSGSGV